MVEKSEHPRRAQPRSTQATQRSPRRQAEPPSRPSQQALDEQRADWEGMTTGSGQDGARAEEDTETEDEDDAGSVRSERAHATGMRWAGTSALTESSAARVVASASRARALQQGLRGVFLLLSEEHGRLGLLLQRLLVAQHTAPPEATSQVLSALRRELLAHEHAEREALLRTVPAALGGTGLERARANDEERIEHLLEQLDKLPAGSHAAQRRSHDLAELVRCHMYEEEALWFPVAMHLLGAEGAQRLEACYLKAKERALSDHDSASAAAAE